MGQLYEKIEKHIGERFYKKYRRDPHGKVKLTEKNSGGSAPYEVNFFLVESEVNDDIFIIKNLEELKTNQAKYIKTDPPKDCDYVIINETKQKIYFIELKDTSSYSHQSVKEQIEAGEKWLNHLLFCSHMDDNYLEGWGRYNICVKFNNSRPSFTKLTPIQVVDKQIFFVKGNEFPLGKFRI